MIIAISGVDCSGKSTQISRLTHSIKNQRIEIIWGRYGYTPGVEVLKKAYKVVRGDKRDNIAWSSVNSRSKFSLLRFLWKWSAVIDFLFYYGVAVRFFNSSNKTIILDRYLVDFFVDYEYFFGEKMGDVLIAVAKILCCTPRYSFLLNVDVKTSLERMALKNDPFPETRESIEKRCRLYVKYWGSGVIIDAGRGEDDVFEDIRSHIEPPA